MHKFGISELFRRREKPVRRWHCSTYGTITTIGFNISRLTLSGRKIAVKEGVTREATSTSCFNHVLILRLLEVLLYLGLVKFDAWKGTTINFG